MNAWNAGAIFLVAAFLSWRWVMVRRKRRHLPPGPAMALPILGHMHLLGPLPHRSMHKLSQTYGPILFLRLGSSPTVVLSSSSLAKQFLHDHDEAFAFRPGMEFGKLVFYNKGSALMQPDDRRWKVIRRLYVQEVLSPKSILSYKHVRDEEISLLLLEVRSKATAGENVVIRSLANRYIFSVMTCLLFSQRSLEGELSEFPSIFNVLSKLFAQPLIGDFVPYLRWLDPGGLRKKVIVQAGHMNALLQGILDQRLLLRRSSEASPADVLTVFLDSFGMPDNPDYDLVKASILEILTGSTDTTTAAVEWAMAELLCAPKSKLAKLQEEISAVVQTGQQVEESHFNSLPYLQAVVKETLRLHPPVPLLLPHLARDPIEIAGFSLPRNTRLFVNVWAIGRDASLWEAAHEFKPERFLVGGHASDVGLFGGQSYQLLLPFGRGRRGCPGSHLAVTMISLVIANLVHGFHWYPSCSSIPEDEVMGMSNMLAKPFSARPTIRY
ncbi:hypothetical protein GOP47_0024950 [Adiantum capillus-veneris]|uniref:Cytochrome P450 n=1 Tax=Adiantum capillus-veneris TaxID=13818 RepID=A0A9D4U330_ADICA|nr:hypothetical protein GOP47_0024950 [Adiantum capillus-veneris]